MQHRYFGLTGAGPERLQNDKMSQCGALGNASVESLLTPNTPEKTGLREEIKMED
jgi:hypothetical protein